ncbi:hypothetical protein QUF90_17030 [Desulfococcaceae bacterium HSG9]|nr:hypothetical protein [Desulfococcaceae bacterium HSG9]
MTQKIFESLYPAIIPFPFVGKELTDEVKELLTLFSGQKIDIEDIRTMDRQLGQFERDIALWHDYNIPTDELFESAAGIS